MDGLEQLRVEDSPPPLHAGFLGEFQTSRQSFLGRVPHPWDADAAADWVLESRVSRCALIIVVLTHFHRGVVLVLTVLGHIAGLYHVLSGPGL